MNAYLLFACESYYPEGGWNDFKLAFPYMEETRSEVLLKAVEHATTLTEDRWHLVDASTLGIVKYGKKVV